VISGQRPPAVDAAHIEPARIEAWAVAALEHVDLQDIDDPAGVVATVDGLQGVWAHGADVPAAKQELFEVLIDWAALKIEHGDDDIPSIDGVSLYVAR